MTAGSGSSLFPIPSRAIPSGVILSGISTPEVDNHEENSPLYSLINSGIISVNEARALMLDRTTEFGITEIPGEAYVRLRK